MIPGDVAYDGAPSAPEPSAPPEIAPSTAMVVNHEDPPPLYPSAARAQDSPPESQRERQFDAQQHFVEWRLATNGPSSRRPGPR